MAQIVFFILLVITLLVGAFAYFAPTKPINPLKALMDGSGYTSLEAKNDQRTNKINLVTAKGLVKERVKMDEIASERNNFLDTIQAKQQALHDTNKDAYDILLDEKAKKQSVKPQQQSQDLLDEEKQKAQDQQQMMQQRIADGQQRIQDQQNH